VDNEVPWKFHDVLIVAQMEVQSGGLVKLLKNLLLVQFEDLIEGQMDVLLEGQM
jgi:hypothetical protein